jgi:hypothetical protein
MPLDFEIVDVAEGEKEIHVFDVDRPQDRHLAYAIDRNRKKILFYPRDDFVVPIVTLNGFRSLPDEFSERGYIKAGLMYYLDKKFKEQNVYRFFISKTDADSIRKVRDGYRAIMSYSSLQWIKNKLTQMSNEAKAERSQVVDEFFAKTYPRKYSSTTVSAARRASHVVKNLDESIIEHLGPDDQNQIFDFIEILLKKRYKSVTHKRRLFRSAKLKVDDIAVSEVLNEFEELLDQNPNETKWGKFLEKNLYLLDSKYVSVIPQLNVVLAGARKVDFGLVDSNGFLDLFEIKKPTTPLFAARQDRGNHYWNTEAVKAITQAEKYLFNAERKASSLTEDIKREVELSVSVKKPRAFLIIGMTSQLDSEAKKDDFRVLRMSLKNVEIILYDELFERLKNQKNKIYIE